MVAGGFVNIQDYGMSVTGWVMVLLVDFKKKFQQWLSSVMPFLNTNAFKLGNYLPTCVWLQMKSLDCIAKKKTKWKITSNDDQNQSKKTSQGFSEHIILYI